MKQLWVHLMPYTELPDGFRERNPSVRVDIHSRLFDPERTHHMYNHFMDEMEFAADRGFDAVCCSRHHSNGYGLMPSPNLIASSPARRKEVNNLFERVSEPTRMERALAENLGDRSRRPGLGSDKQIPFKFLSTELSASEGEDSLQQPEENNDAGLGKAAGSELSRTIEAARQKPTESNGERDAVTELEAAREVRIGGRNST